MKFIGEIIGGELKFTSPDKLRSFLEEKDGKAIITINRGNTRSLDQNELYWGVVLPALTANGDDELLWHARCKVAFIPQIYGLPQIEWGKLDDEQIVKYARAFTTTELTTKQFTTYIEAIKRMAATRLQLYIE